MSVVTVEVGPAAPLGVACSTLLQLPRQLNTAKTAVPRTRDTSSRNRFDRAIDMADVLLLSRVRTRYGLSGLTTLLCYAQALSQCYLLIRDRFEPTAIGSSAVHRS
jgi:hypothetical protein